MQCKWAGGFRSVRQTRRNRLYKSGTRVPSSRSRDECAFGRDSLLVPFLFFSFHVHKVDAVTADQVGCNQINDLWLRLASDTRDPPDAVSLAATPGMSLLLQPKETHCTVLCFGRAGRQAGRQAGTTRTPDPNPTRPPPPPPPGVGRSRRWCDFPFILRIG